MKGIHSHEQTHEHRTSLGNFIIAWVTTLFGVLWTLFAFGITCKFGSFGPMGFLFPAIGLIFVGIGIVEFLYLKKTDRS